MSGSNFKEHHAKGSIVAKLEIAGIDESAGNRVQEEAAEYGDRDLPASAAGLKAGSGQNHKAG